jgi:two-component system, NarL family, response regulator DevR
MEDERPIRLLLVDDHELVRVGLRILLEAAPQVAIVGEASSVAEALAAVAERRPDVVVLDMRLPDGTGAEACRRIRAAHPQVQVLILSAFDDDIVPAIQAGAAGYVLKNINLPGLLDAIGKVARGERHLGPRVTERVMDWVRDGGAPVTVAEDERLAQLSEQERRILPLIAEGKTNREIAEVLALSEHTVKIYVSDLLSKLNCKRRSQAAAFIARRPDLAATLHVDGKRPRRS